jgi:hypothetical protein
MLTPNKGDREHLKFREAANNLTKVAVELEQSFSNPIPVIQSFFPAPPQLRINLFNDVSAIAPSVQTNLISYTVPITRSFALEFVEVSGENIAYYSVELNTVKIADARTSFTGFNHKFLFNNLELIESDNLVIKVIHTRLSASNHSARIMGVLI